MFGVEWLFVAAAAIAVVGILAAVRNTMDSMAELENRDDQKLSSIQGKFFLSIALIEIIPILLVVLGFVLVKGPPEAGGTLPLAVVIILLLFGITNVLMKKNAIVSSVNDPELKSVITTFMFIGMGLIAAFPIIAFVGIIVMGG